MKETKDINGKVTDSKVITEMSDEEIKKFEEDWKDYWIPTITDEQIESGEFENELNALTGKEPTESVKVNMAEDKEIKRQSIERESAIEDLDISSGSKEKSLIVDRIETADILTSIDEEEMEESAIEAFVMEHPLKVFYFGLAMLITAVMVFQCCFLPQYPPCSWIKCILECVREANEGEL